MNMQGAGAGKAEKYGAEIPVTSYDDTAEEHGIERDPRDIRVKVR